MKEKKSKLLSLLLAFSMIFNLLPLVNAQESDDDNAIFKQIEDVEEIVDGRFLAYLDNENTKKMDEVLNGVYQEDVVSYLRGRSSSNYSKENEKKLDEAYSFYIRNCEIGQAKVLITKYIKFKKISNSKTEVSLRFNVTSLYDNHYDNPGNAQKIALSNARLIMGKQKIEPSNKTMVKDYFLGDRLERLDQATYIIDKSINDISDLKFEFELVDTKSVKSSYKGVLSYDGDMTSEKFDEKIKQYKPYIVKQLKYKELRNKIAHYIKIKDDKEAFELAYKEYKEDKTDWEKKAEEAISYYKQKRISYIKDGQIKLNGFVKENNKLKLICNVKLDSSWKATEKEFNKPKKIKDVLVRVVKESANSDYIEENMVPNKPISDMKEFEQSLEASMADGLKGQGACVERCGQIIKRADKYFLKIKMNRTFFATDGLNGRISYMGGQDFYQINPLLTNNLAKKMYSTDAETKKLCEKEGTFCKHAYEGYVYDEAEIEIPTFPLNEEETPYEEENKRWVIEQSVCVEAMEYGYVPVCLFYISDMKNYEGFNYKNYSKLDNFRKNIFKAFYMNKDENGHIRDMRSKFFQEKTKIFTDDSIIKVFNLESENRSNINKVFPVISYAETEKAIEAVRNEIKENLVKKDGSTITDSDIDFLNFGMDEVNNYPDEMPYTPIDADMSKSTTEPNSEEPQEEEASVDSVTIKDKDIQIEKGKSYRLEADVAGKNLKAEDKKVDWNLVGSYDKDTTIDKDGNLKVSKSEDAEKIKVKATSEKDSSKSDQADLVIKKSTVTPTPSGDLTKYDENNNNIAAKPIYEDIDSAYEIPVELINHSNNKYHSMAEDALINDKKMIVTEKGGVKKAYLVFDKRTVAGGVEGRLTKLFSFKDNKIETGHANDILCDMLSYNRGKSLGSGSEMLFPYVFNLGNTDFKEGENTIYLRVNVDAMDMGKGEGKGEQIADLKFNTNRKQDLTIDSLKKKFVEFNQPKHMKIVSKDKKTSVSLANVGDNAKLNVGISTSKDNEKLKEVSEKIKNLAELKGKEISKLIHTSIPKDTSIGSEPIFTYQVDCKDLKNPKPYFVNGNKLENIQGARIVGNTLIFGLSRLGDVIITSDVKSPNPPAPNPPTPDPQNPAKVKSVKIEQENIKAKAGKTYKLTAKVEGESLSDEDKAVDWSISGNELTATNIDKNGNLSIAAKESSTKLKVKATSKKDPSKSDEVSVSIDKVEEADKDLAYYEVPVRLMHVGKTEYADNTPSMGDNAIIKTAIVKVEKGKPTYQIKFKGLDFMNLHGHVTKLFVFDEKVKKGSNMTPDSNGKKTEMKVLKHIEDESLIKGLRKKFPEIFEFSRGEKEDEIYVRVNVDAMDSLSSVGKSGKRGDIHSYDEIKQGAGAQSAILRFDWSKARKTDKSNFIGSKDDKDEKDEKVEVKGRLSGDDRYETSVEISKAYFKKADKVVLASGMNDADALVAASYADLSKSPILLTKIKDLPNKTLSEIERLNASEVVIVGGKASVSSSVEKKLKEKGLAVSRVSGSDRYATSIELAKKVVNNSGSNKLVLINGRKNADALTVSSLATSESLPVVMTDGNNVSKSVKKFVKDNDINEVIIVGGNSSMKARMTKQLDVKTRRIAGKDRFETAIKIADEVYPDLEKAILANGYNSIDALSAGAITNIAKAPIILINKNSIPSSVKSRLKNLDEDSIIVVGGKNTINNSVYNKLIN
ncbi:N-acetylmuramoyl-L-alanine amidase [Peptostreptococcus sp. MV1]|uniref:cell wall-binding repeat-containing protein n=1 Tax=Peptostreptococcus sp. MV1 TaxID=1219626 RepID=UPI00050FBF92|nr:cell wall-binding repeat-containing protein [Peptostreptococcus sp. MV1]KGF15380.1 N-acetylmuramoyl-L-alanine amidase [Peptostreptococcus sp. MV1]